MSSPFFSVVVNILNGSIYVPQLIQSIESQLFRDFEVIIVDNSSSDLTYSMLAHHEFSGLQIKLHRTQQTLPLYSARNIALSLCQGRYLAFHDADDVWSSDKLLIYYQRLEQSPSSLIAFGSYTIHTQRGSLINSTTRSYRSPYTKLDNNFFTSYDVAMSSLVLSRTLFQSHQFNPRYQIVGEFEFILRTLLDTLAITVTQHTCTVTQSSKSTSFRNPLQFAKELRHLASKPRVGPRLRSYFLLHSNYKLFQSLTLTTKNPFRIFFLSLLFLKKTRHLLLAFRLLFSSLYLLR